MSCKRLALAAFALTVTAAGAACRAEVPAMTRPTTPASSASVSADQVLPTEAVFGLWALTPVSGTGSCRITLNRIPAGDLFGTYVGRCDLKEAMGASGWRPTANGFELIRTGEAPLRFRQTGVDDFETLDGLYRLRRAPTA